MHSSRRTHKRRDSADDTPQVSLYTSNDAEGVVSVCVDGGTNEPPTTSVHSLPPEILLHVMSYFVHDLSELGGELYPKLPFIAASVCQTWRHVALDTPSMWTLCLSIDRGLRHASEYVDFVTSRSRHVPLTVYVQTLDDIDETTFAGLDEIMPKVVERAGHLTVFQRSDQLTADDTMEINVTVLKYLCRPTPYLHTISVDHCDVELATEVLLPSTPALKDILVRRLSPTKLSRSAFVNVRELRVRSNITMDHVLALSRIAPDLELLSLDDIDDDDFEYGTPNTTARFDALRTLALHNVHEIRAFPTNAFPSLDVLDIRVTSQDGPTADSIPFMPVLRTLRVHCADRSGNTHTKVSALISRVRHIERLEIWTRRNTESLWDCLLEPDDTLVPDLRHLIVNVKGYIGFQHTDEGDRIANFLETREARRQVSYGRIPNRIHRVELYGTRMPTPSIDRIRRCVSVLILGRNATAEIPTGEDDAANGFGV